MRLLVPSFLLAMVLPCAATVEDPSASNVAVQVAPPDEHNAVVSHATPHDRLFAVTFDGDKGTAVGEAGLVMDTTDGGKTWTQEKAPTELTMISIASNGQRTIAVGQMGLVLVRDGAGDWRKVESGSQARLLGVGINKGGAAFIVGAFGTLLKSTDGGDTWASVAPNWAGLYDSGSGDTAVLRDEPTNYVVHVEDSGAVLIGGEYGQLMRSPDGGTCWDIVYRHPADVGKNPPTFFAVNIRTDGVGYAVGQSGLIARTADDGKTWTYLATPVTGNLFGVDSFADGEVAAVGQRVALRSKDDGQSWDSVKALDLALNWYAGMGHSASAKAGEVIAVGHSGRILRLSP